MRNFILSLSLCIGLALPTLALADMSRDEAARLAQQQTGGKVLSVDSRNGGYRVKVLKDNGEIVILQFNNEPVVAARPSDAPAMGFRDNQRSRQPDDNRNGNGNGKENRRFFPLKDGF